MSRWFRLVATGLPLAALTTVAFGAWPDAVSAASAQAETRPVVVMLRDQLPASPPGGAHSSARLTQSDAVQHSVLSALPGATPENIKDFSLGNAFAATVSPAQLAALVANPAVAEVIPDETVALWPPDTAVGGTKTEKTVGLGGRTATGGTAADPVCPGNPGKPLLEPEALSSIHAASTAAGPGAQQLATGAGVTVGIIADGVDPDNADFIRANGQHVIVDSVNFSGRPAATATGGLEAFGDVSSIAAQGLVTHDLSTYVNAAHPLPTGCDIRILGVSPGASIVAIDAVDSGTNDTTISTLLQSIDYAVNVAHVNVLNESFGVDSIPDATARDAVELFNDEAVAAGVTVTVAAGDSGLTSTIDSPAADPEVIDVGASTDFQAITQTGGDGAPLGNGTWADDNISALSSGGFTQDGTTVDLVAPGEEGWAACTASALYQLCVNESGDPSSIAAFMGTSEATPLTAGTAALVIQTYRRAHSGLSPSPALVKALLTGTAQSLSVPAQDQGAGLLDARAAVEAALTYPGATSGAPTGAASHLMLSTDQLSNDGTPGSSRTDEIGVTNVGTRPLTVTAGMSAYRNRGPASVQSIALDTSTDPTFVGADGTTQAYQKASIVIAPGADVLSVEAAWPADQAASGWESSGGNSVSVSLFDSSGKLVADSFPQGGGVSANYANLLVRKPAAGTWTALLYTAASAPFNGTVQLRATEQDAVPVGRTSPAVFTLQPGAHRSISVTSTFPASSGDSADSVTFHTSAGDTVDVPDVLRALILLAGGEGTFAGSITGGNGRGGSPAQTFTYAFDVPDGAPGLNVSATLARDVGDILSGVLVAPDGETPSIGSNDPEQSPDMSKSDPSLSLSVTDPEPGQWRFVLAAQNPVSGDGLSMPFTGKVSLRSGANVTTSGLPDSAATVLPAGSAHAASVTVTNTSPATVYVQTDARTSAVQTLSLASRYMPGTASSPTITLPLGGFDALSFLVPPETTSITATDSSSVPSQVELFSAANSQGWGGLDATGDLTAAQNGATTSVATVAERDGYVGQGDWTVAATEIGPFGPGGEPAGQATFSMTATTLGFDRAVASSTGDPYTESSDGGASTGTPVAIAPGASATITLLITPDAAPGTTIAGTLNIVTPGDATVAGVVVLQPEPTSGDLLATVPYSYTVGAPAES